MLASTPDQSAAPADNGSISADAAATSDTSDTEETGASGITDMPASHEATPAAEHDEPPADGEPLTFAPGQAVGQYTVTQALSAAPANAPFVAILAESAETGGAAEVSGLHYLLQPLDAADTERAHAVIIFGLQHSRLLVPRAVASVEEQHYLVVEVLADADGTAPRSLSGGAHLSAVEALRAGSGLADALAYLHRNGLAHGHIAPDAIFVRDARAYLGRLERATSLGPEAPQAADEMRADANALARALGELVAPSGLAVNAEQDANAENAGGAGEDAAQLANIVAKGQANGYETADELVADFGAATATTFDQAEALPETAALSGQEVPQERFILRMASATTVGMVRSENQDAVATMHFEVHDDLIGDMPAGVFLVADGMGGEAHGEVASRIAARIVTSEMARSFFAPLVAIPATVASESGNEPLRADEDLAAALVRAVTAANAQVRALAEYLGQPTGTTLTALAIRGMQAVVAHLGDSRAYLLHDGTLRMLTEDHSLLARMEALDHPLLHDDSLFISRSILYRSLGQEDAAPPDVLDVPLAMGDRVMLCSDGLWDELKDDIIERVMIEGPDPQTCANELVRLANDAGGNDNSTALVLFVEPEPTDIAIPARTSGAPGEETADSAENADGGANAE